MEEGPGARFAHSALLRVCALCSFVLHAPTFIHSPYLSVVNQRTSVALIALGSLGVLAAYTLTFFGGSDGAPWLMAAGATLVLTGLGLLGAGPKAPRLASAVIVACFSTFIGLAFGLSLEAPVPNGPLLFGFPLSTAVMLLYAGAVPLVVLPIVYAWAFPREVAQDSQHESSQEGDAS